MKVSGNFILQCKSCNSLHTFSSDEHQFDMINPNERPMGIESGYEWCFNYECETCSETIEGEYNVWEYPPGINSQAEINVDEANIVNKFQISFSGY